MTHRKQERLYRMNEQAKEARRAYYREWSRKNREKRREYFARYWEKRAAAAAEQIENAAKNAPVAND